MNATVASLTSRSLLGRKRTLVLLLLPLALLALCVLARVLAGLDADIERELDGALAPDLLGAFGIAILMPLLSLIAGTGSIGPEIDEGSIVYLLAKPLNRYSIVVTKLAVAIGVVIVFGVLPIAVAGVVLTGEVGTVTVAFAVGALAAGVAYSAVFLLLAVITPERRRHRPDLRPDLGVAGRRDGPRGADAEHPAVVTRGRATGAGRRPPTGSASRRPSASAPAWCCSPSSPSPRPPTRAGGCRRCASTTTPDDAAPGGYLSCFTARATRSGKMSTSTMSRCASPAYSCSAASSGITRVFITTAEAIRASPAATAYGARLRHRGSRRSLKDKARNANGLTRKNIIPPTM